MSAVAAAVLCGVAVLVGASPGRAAVRLGHLWGPERPGRAVPPTGPDARAGPGALGGARGTWLAVAVTAVACAVVVGGVPGVVAGGIAAAVCHRVLSRLEPRSVRDARRRAIADLPAAADLLAACLLSGAPMIDAAEAVATALGGPMAASLREVAAAIRLGADPADAWRALGSRPGLAPMARAIARAMAGGAPLADALTRLADERRHALRAEASAAARRVGVRAAAPLGLCFLPAFVLLGVAPVIASIAASVVLP